MLYRIFISCSPGTVTKPSTILSKVRINSVYCRLHGELYWIVCSFVYAKSCFCPSLLQHFKAAHISNSNFNFKFSTEHMYNYDCWDWAGKWPFSRWLLFLVLVEMQLLKSWRTKEFLKIQKYAEFWNDLLKNPIVFSSLFIFFQFCNACITLNCKNFD